MDKNRKKKILKIAAKFAFRELRSRGNRNLRKSRILESHYFSQTPKPKKNRHSLFLRFDCRRNHEKRQKNLGKQKFKKFVKNVRASFDPLKKSAKFIKSSQK